MANKVLSTQVDETIVQLIDAHRAANFTDTGYMMNRSEFIRRAIYATLELEYEASDD